MWRFPFGLDSEGDIECLRHPKPWRNEKADLLPGPPPPPHTHTVILLQTASHLLASVEWSLELWTWAWRLGKSPGTDLWYSAAPVLSSF
jgi:hypothetical protein